MFSDIQKLRKNYQKHSSLKVKISPEIRNGMQEVKRGNKISKNMLKNLKGKLTIAD